MIKDNEEIQVGKVAYVMGSLFFTVAIHTTILFGIMFVDLEKYIPLWVHLVFFVVLFVYFYVSSIRYEEKYYRYKPEEEFENNDNQEW